MCIKSGNRCEICNDPTRTRARQNISNKISKIADANQERLEQSQYSYEAINTPTSPEAIAIASSDTYLTSFKDATEVFRNERSSYANDREWILGGKEDTPENFNVSLEERGRKITAIGEVVEARSEFLLPKDYYERLAAREQSIQILENKIEYFKNPNREKAIALQDELKIKYGKTGADLSYRREASEEEMEKLTSLENLGNKAQRGFLANKVTLKKLNSFTDKEAEYIQKSRIAANMQAISEIRAIGGEPVKFEQRENIPYGTDELKTVIADPDTQHAFQDAIQNVYPKDWLEHANKNNKLAIETHQTPTDSFYHREARPDNPYTHTVRPFEGIENDDRYEGWVTAYDDTGRDTKTLIGLNREHKVFNEGDIVDTENGWRRGKMVDDIWGEEIEVVIRDEPSALKHSTYSQENVNQIVIPKASDTKYGDSSRIYAHEFGHHMQNTIPAIHHMENWWATKRTTLPDGSREPLRKLPSGASYRQDQFAHWYMGREYKDGVLSTKTSFKEVFTVGTESLFKGSYGGLDGVGIDTPLSATPMDRSDKDMKRLMFGIYAGI